MKYYAEKKKSKWKLFVTCLFKDIRICTRLELVITFNLQPGVRLADNYVLAMKGETHSRQYNRYPRNFIFGHLS